MKIVAEFVRSAATAADLPRDALAEVALVGRSNVGKSSLINALVRQRVARTSGAPGKTRLANIYRVGRGGSAPFYLVDLPGYGFARGGAETERAFAEVTRAYFGQVGRVGQVGQVGQVGRVGQVSRAGQVRRRNDRPDSPDPPDDRQPRNVAALLLVDARHPGLESDADAWRWLRTVSDRTAVAVTKIDKLSRAERARALPRHERTYEHPVVAVSAVTGEGLDELWKLIDRLTKSG